MTMQPGTFVRHQSQPSWGTGKVLELVAPDKVRIRFSGAGEKLLLLSAAALEKVEPTAADEKALTERRARARKAQGAARSHESVVEEFLARYPGGFSSPEYVKAERGPRMKAHELAQQELGAEKLVAARDAGRFDEVVDAAMVVLNATTLVFPNEKIALRNGLASPAARASFTHAFVELLHGTGSYQERFSEFAEFLAEVDAGKWTLATYFPYFLYPQEHMFLKPQVTQKAADAYSFALDYDAQPNWNTYEKLLAFSRMLKDRTAPLGPADMFDVQAFLWTAGSGGPGGS